MDLVKANDPQLRRIRNHENSDDAAGSSVQHGQRCGVLGRALAVNTTVISVDLSFCRFGDSGIGGLCGNLPAQLQFLVLQDNEITDIGANWIAKALTRCPKLQKLDLADNSIKDSGATALAAVIGELKHLEHLDISWNEVERKGANAIFGGIKHCKQLRHVNLGDAMVLKGLGESDLPAPVQMFQTTPRYVMPAASGEQ